MDLSRELHQLTNDCHLHKVRFGKTNLEMPIVSLGCIRFEQRMFSRPELKLFNNIAPDCQGNLVKILHRTIFDYGITHIETARAYGFSELQLG